MQRWKRFLFGCGLFGLTLGAGAQQYARWVDPYLGSEGGGHVFVGATVPFGMVKAGPDVGDNTGNGGWLPEGNVNGFSQTHVSGTGGGAKYGNILVQPVVGDVRGLGDHSSARSGEHVEAGLYRVRLDRYATDVEVTTSARAALYRFRFPVGKQENVLIDAGHCLSSYPNQGEDQRVIASAVRLRSSHEASGWTTVVGGWNEQKKPYKVYFYAATDAAGVKFGAWKDGAEQALAVGGEVTGRKTGLWMELAGKRGGSVGMKVGISFLSEAQAQKNAKTEIAGFDFERVLAKARGAWDEVLGKIDVDGVTDEQKQIFYTSLYHAMLMPTDRTGENPEWNSLEPSYDDYYAIWDTFRTSGPLLTLILPERQRDMVRSLIDIYKHEGWLPDARSGNSTGRTQGGSNAEFEIADAYVKGLQGINWEDGYAAMKHDAEVAPPDQIMEGRGGLAEWKTKGYVTMEGVDRPGSKQMEYAADDYEIALLAKGLGKREDAELYLQRSRNWEKLWNDAAEEDGVKGFIWPRHADGSWKAKFDGVEGCSWGGDTFYEGNSWTYSTFVPQDNARLVAKAGGSAAFARRLDLFFSGAGRYDVGNEPGFMAPYLYLWTKQPEKTAEHIHAILAKSYHAGRDGIPGNDDSGAMSSWYAFGVMGIYPNAGQDVYLIGSPSIPKTTLHVGDGKRFVIEAVGLSDANLYVDHAELNGKPWEKAWFRHEDIVNGGSLVLHMAAKPGAWPTGAMPPSASDGEAVMYGSRKERK